MKSPKIIILGIDGLEYNLVEKWQLKNLMQKNYCKLELSDYKVVVTPPIWGSMLTGKIDEEIINIWIKHAELLGLDENHKKKWWEKIGEKIPSKINFWIWDHIITPLKGGDPFEKTANYVKDKNEKTVFDFFEKTWNNGIPSYGRNVSQGEQKKLTEQAIAGNKKPYRKYILKTYFEDKEKLLSVLKNKEIDLIFWYTPYLDNMGHMDMGKPVGLMMKHYLNINQLVGKIKKEHPDSKVFIISDHGMEKIDEKQSSWGMHSNHAFFSSNTDDEIKKPFELFSLVSKYSEKNLD